MRRLFAVGMVLAGFAGAPAWGQFAGDRTPAPKPPAPAAPQLPGGVQPVGFTEQPKRSAGQVLPSGFELPDPVRKDPLKPIPTTYDAKAAPHPWSIKAEDGDWMIIVKAYVGPDSKAMAEKLAADIRKTHNTKSLLYERNALEREAEIKRIEQVKKAEEERNKPFLEAMKQAEIEAKANGTTFVKTEAKIKINRPLHETPEQWAVLIGGFKTMDDARKAIDTVKKFPAPKDTTLMDLGGIGAEVTDTKTEKTDFKSKWDYLNPYPNSMVVPNPLTSKSRMEEKAKLEPFVVELNKGLENSLLEVKKPWTLMVKSYSAPLKRATGKDGEGDNVFKKVFGTNEGNILRATASDADGFAKALRHKDMKPRPYDAYVLHHRTGSIVTVGQFNAPDDPELIELQKELLGITFICSNDKDKKPLLGPDGKPLVQRLFDGVSLFPVPKY